MIRSFISLLLEVLFPKKLPYIKNLRESQDDLLHPEGLTMGSVVMGKPGSGKTSWLAKIIVWLLKNFPKWAFFILDPSGSLVNSILSLILQEPLEVRNLLLEKIIFVDLGNKDVVVPLPSFSPLYGTGYEEQAQLLAKCFQQLSPHLSTLTPVMGGVPLHETAPELFRLLCAIQDEQGDCWQVTEAKKLLIDFGLLRKAVKEFGGKVPEAKWYFEKEFLSEDLSKRERELRTYTLRSVFGMIEPRVVRAMLGYPNPGFTPKEAIEKGKLVLISGEKLINQPSSQHFLFAFIFLLIMATINQRIPGDPNDEPVVINADEVYALLRIAGMADEIGTVGPLYRSRKLILIIVIQALWQLEKELREKIWSLGNLVCFAIENHDEAYAIAKQLFYYDPTRIKAAAPSESHHPIYEPDRGAYLEQANWIQSLKHRQFIMRRYISEQMPDPYVRFVERTAENTVRVTKDQIEALKNELLRKYGMSVSEALEVINKRTIGRKPQKPKSV
jgi:hypothetical protein